MSRCPPLRQLEQLLEEELADADQRSLSAHVAACDDCQAVLAKLTEEADSLAVPAVSFRRHAEALPGEPSASAFLARLKETPPSSIATPGSGPQNGPSAGRSGPAPIEPPAVEGYEIVGELGRGGMGVVYKARQVALNRPVALKMILHAGHAAAKDVARFRQEAEAVARLHHPNIVQVHAVGEAEGRPYFAMEFLAGGSLAQRLRGDPQPVMHAARLIETLARAIHFAHLQSVVHRDLKPANILFTAAGRVHFPLGATGESTLADYGFPKITDFGLAKRLDGHGGGTHTGELVGTPSYMAPEQAGAQTTYEVGPAADTYALGAILYEMLTGRPPFKGATPLDTVLLVLHQEPVRPGHLRPGLPRDLETICLKCLEKEPRKRYPSAEALADDLRSFRRGAPIMARPVGPVERAWKWTRRRPLTAALLGGMILSAVLGFAGVTWQWQVAVAEKQQADDARRKADDARAKEHAERQKAETERQKADAARQRAGSALYFSRIVDSQLQWRVNDFMSARHTLDLCRPSSPRFRDRRGWEWYYLRNLFHSDLLHLRQPPGEQGGDVAVTSDGRWIAATAGQVRVWDARSGRPVHALREPDTYNRLAPHPDGCRFALANTGGDVRLWDSATGKEVWRRGTHAQMVTGLAFSPDGRFLASASWDRTVKVCDAASGKVLTTFDRHRDRVQCVAFHPTGGRIASGGWDNLVKVWDANGSDVRDLSGHKSAVTAVAFSPDGKLLASAASNGNLRVWDLQDGRVIQSLTGQTGGILCLAFSPDGRFIAYGGGDGTVRVWHVKAAVESVTFRGHGAAVSAVCFSPDGRRIVSSCAREGSVRVWDFTRHPEFATLARTGLGPLAVEQKHVEVRDLERDPTHLAEARTGPDVEALAFTEDGRRIISVTVGGKLQSWDAATGLLQEERPLAMAKELVTPAVLAAFAPGGKRLAARCLESTRVVNVWDAATGKVLLGLPEHAAPVFCVRFSGDGRRLATCACALDRAGRPHEVKVWDAQTGKLLTTLPGAGLVFDLVFTPDGRRLARAGQDGTVRVADLETGKEVLNVRGHEGGVGAVAVSPDGQLLASAGAKDRAIRFWDLSAIGTGREGTATPLRVLKAPPYLGNLAFCPPRGPRKGLRLVGVSRDLVQMWDAQTGQAVLTLRGAPHRHWDPPFNPRVTFSPDGTRLAATNWDESISVWDAPLQADGQSSDQILEVRREAAERRAPLWHLQEAEQCLEHKNEAAAKFHLARLGSGLLPRPLQQRREQLLQRLGQK